MLRSWAALLHLACVLGGCASGAGSYNDGLGHSHAELVRWSQSSPITSGRIGGY